MTLLSGDLTTPARFQADYPIVGTSNLASRITAASTTIISKLNRGRLYSQPYIRIFNGQGNYLIELPDYPVTSLVSVQMGASLVLQSPLPVPNSSMVSNNLGYGVRFVPWNGTLPGEPSILEFVNGWFWPGLQNIKITYNAGYLISGEQWTIPNSPTYEVVVLQPLGIWCRDNGVTYSNGTPLIPVTSLSGAGQYIPPTDTTLGLYQFDSLDAGKSILINYSFVPADLEWACSRLIAEGMAYLGRIGEISKSLGGQETVSFLRGGRTNQHWPDLAPEIEGVLLPYLSVIPPAIGADT